VLFGGELLRDNKGRRKGMIGIEAAIILIAFVIVASAFSFMVINMGLTSTQRGKEAISTSLQEVLSPLQVDGSIMIKSEDQKVVAIIIPLKVSGVNYVPMGVNRTVVSLKITGYGNVQSQAYPNIYSGVNKTRDPAKESFDDILDNNTWGIPTPSGRKADAWLFLEENNKDDAFDFFEKGYLIIKLDSGLGVTSRCIVDIEVRPERGAPLTLSFIVPANLPMGTHYIVVG
jgi:flagellin FlaB